MPSWNNSNSNLVSIEVVDPDNPTQKRRQFFNKQTEEVTADAGWNSYAQPVNASGMTSAQENTDADRDASRSLGRERFAETKRKNFISEGQAERRVTSSGARQ